MRKLIYLANIGLSASWAHEIQIMKMCEAFRQNEIDVELVVPRRWINFKGDPFLRYNVEKKFKITRVFCLDLAPGNPNALNFWLRVLSFLFFARIYLFFKKYDIFYSREDLAGFFFNDINLEIHSLPKKIKSWHKKIWQKAKKLIVLTSFIKEKLIEEGIAQEKILIAPDAVDLREFGFEMSKGGARKKLSLPLEKKIIVYAGSFFSPGWKGVDVLLEAIKYFSEDFLFVLVGGLPNEIERDQFKNLILTGRQPHREIPFYLKAADVLVLPNKKGDKISEEYTSPLKLFEYMASGRPIVASDLPSIRQILNENNAVLVKANDPDSLANGIKKILTDEQLAVRISQQAIQDVQPYTWEERTKLILKFIAINL